MYSEEDDDEGGYPDSRGQLSDKDLYDDELPEEEDKGEKIKYELEDTLCLSGESKEKTPPEIPVQKERTPEAIPEIETVPVVQVSLMDR